MFYWFKLWHIPVDTQRSTPSQILTLVKEYVSVCFIFCPWPHWVQLDIWADLGLCHDFSHFVPDCPVTLFSSCLCNSINPPIAAVKKLLSGVFWDPSATHDLVTGSRKAGISLKYSRFRGNGFYRNDQYISLGSQKTPESSRKVKTLTLQHILWL